MSGVAADPTELVADPTDLDQCALEPIHVPGSIQPHGYLFAIDPDNLTVVAASANAAETMGVRPRDIIGRPIATILIPTTGESMDAALAPHQAWSPLRVRFAQAAQPTEWDCVTHPAEAGLILLELGPGISSGRAETLLGGIRHAIERIRNAETPQGACETLAREIRALIGFDRVMIYQFDTDWNGEVIAEDRVPGAHSYLGHAFPASDIPAQARALYLRNPVRLIPDASYTPSPLVPSIHPATGQPIDLSVASLRSVSPTHLEYLANMDVAASMSVSIVRDGALWGLVACHHPAPRLLPIPLLQACELLAQAASWYLDADDRSATAECFVTERRLEAELAAKADGRLDYRVRLDTIAPGLLDLTMAQGIAICDGQTVWTTGVVPPDEQILRLAAWLQQAGEVQLITNRLSALFPPATACQGVASGVAARRLPGGWLFCFRAEWPHTQVWAGDMSTPVKATSDSGRINPRKSFAAWRQVIYGASRPWTARDLSAVDRVKSLVLRTIMTDQMRRLERKLALQVYHDRTVDELKAASTMQIDLLPSVSLQKQISAKTGLDIAGRLGSCSELGGDLWGMCDLGDGRVGAYVVDFAGHGITAALNTFRLHTLIPEFSALLPDPARFLKALNLRLVELLSTADYATIFYCVVDPQSNCLSYAGAGSPPPIIRCGDGLALTSLDSRGLPLGITASAEYASKSAVFGPGAALFLYSDGLTDCHDAAGNRIGEAGAFTLVQSYAAGPSAEAIVAGICAPFLDQRTVPLSDDLTVVCIRRP